MWYQENNLFLNVTKTRELIVFYRKQGGEDAPIHIDEAKVGWVESFKFLCVQITKDLKWSTHVCTVVTKASQNFFPLRG